MDVGEDPYPEPTDFILLMHLGTIIVIPVATLAAYCIIFRTPRQIRQYSNLLLNHLIWATLTEIVFNTGSTPVIYSPNIAGRPYGFLNLLPISTHVQLCIGLFLLIGTADTIFHIYIHRVYSLLRFDRKLKKKRFYYSLVVLIYVLTLGCVIFLGIVLAPDVAKNKEIARATFQYVPRQLDDDRVVVYIVEDNFWLNVTVYLILLFIVGGSLFCGIMAAISFYELKKSSETVSKKTADLQMAYLKSLVLQMSIFFLVLVVPAFLIVVTVRIGYKNNTLVNCLIFILSLNGTADTICVLLLNKAYRNSILRLIVIIYYRVFLCSKPHEGVLTPSGLTEIFSRRRRSTVANISSSQQRSQVTRI